jgi:hypothetical protein
MDIRIKGSRDGVETADVLRQSFGVPVVFLTAHADDITLNRAKRTAPYGYLHKPVKPAALRSTIEVALYNHAMERKARLRERWFSTTLHSIAAVEDKDGFKDDDGCADIDNDNDTIADVVDACVNEAEDKDGFKDEDGCVDPDNDNDLVPDGPDACRDVAGPTDNAGCPWPDATRTASSTKTTSAKTSSVLRPSTAAPTPTATASPTRAMRAQRLRVLRA